MKLWYLAFISIKLYTKNHNIGAHFCFGMKLPHVFVLYPVFCCQTFDLIWKVNCAAGLILCHYKLTISIESKLIWSETVGERRFGNFFLIYHIKSKKWVISKSVQSLSLYNESDWNRSEKCLYFLWISVIHKLFVKMKQTKLNSLTCFDGIIILRKLCLIEHWKCENRRNLSLWFDSSSEFYLHFVTIHHHNTITRVFYVNFMIFDICTQFLCAHFSCF